MGSFVNTIAITVPATVLVVVIGSLAGYAFAWIDFPGRDWLLIVVIVLLAVPLQVALIPIARLFGSIGLFGSILGVMLFHMAFGLPFAIFLLRNFFTQVPGEMLEAARLDGASEWRIFSRIILPLGLPAIASPRHLPVPLDLERHARRADLHERDLAAGDGRDPEPVAAVRREHRHAVVRRVPVDDHPADRVLRLPALLRLGAARGLHEVVQRRSSCGPSTLAANGCD